MSWRILIEADVLTVLCNAELEGYRAAALATGQADPVQPTIDQVTDLVRGYIAANKANTLGAAGLPSKLIAPALDIVAFRIPSRVGEKPEESRRDLNNQAIKLLEQVAAGAFAIEDPSTPSTEAIASPSPSFGTRCQHFSRQDQDGI